MRTFLIILVIVIILGYIYFKKIAGKFDFGNPKFIGADLKGILTNGGFATIDLTSTINNKNNFSVPVDGLYVEVYYKGQVVGKSTAPHDKFIIPANGSIAVTQNITLSLTSSLDIAGQLLTGNTVTFQYMVRAKVFNFFPLTLRGSFNY